MDFIIRADDLGYCEAVNYGIAKTVNDGLVRSVGLMPNMPAAKHGLALLKNTRVCLGQHTNVCVGKPCSNPYEIPSMVDAEGYFIKSDLHRKAYQQGRDLIALDDAIREVEAQYFRFKELTGNEPAYFEGHAIMSDNLFRALEIVAEKYHLKYNRMSLDGKSGLFNQKPIHNCIMESGREDYDPFATLKKAVATAREDMPNVFICHPGYLDQYILQHSSLTINRTKEVAMLCDPDVQRWLREQNVHLLSYDELSISRCTL